jgi:CCAAT-binding transcription factor (CBF-B/NF-YA) subunit B
LIGRFERSNFKNEPHANFASAMGPVPATAVLLPTVAVNLAASTTPPALLPLVDAAAMSLPATAEQPPTIAQPPNPATQPDNVLLVNLRQRVRFIKRRLTRQALIRYYDKCSANKEPTDPNYTHESRHQHATKRPRNSHGRYIKKGTHIGQVLQSTATSR